MSPEAQRIAIAKTCGWKMVWSWDHDCERNIWCLSSPSGTLYPKFFGDQEGKTTIEKHIGYLPDYLNDLNAMHEAEDVLTLEQTRKYTELLEDIADIGPNTPDLRWFNFCHAPAGVRAKAFLKTLNLWKDGNVT